MSAFLSFALSAAIVCGVAFGILAVFPRRLSALFPATATILIVFTILTYVGSALVGPADFRQMLVPGPLTLVFSAIWFFWKIKPAEGR